MKRFLPLLLVLVLVGTLEAQNNQIVVQAQGIKKMRVAMPTFAGPADLTTPTWAQIKKDIEITGVFELIDPKAYVSQAPVGALAQANLKDYALIGADFLITGSIERMGANATLRLEAAEVATGRVISRYAYRQPANILYGSVHDFMDRYLKDSLGLSAIFSSRIVAVLKTGGAKVLYTCWADGSAGQAIIKGRPGDLVLSPAWSPDGQRIAFVSYARGNPDLYLYQLFPPKITPLSTYRGLNSAPAFLPRERKIAATLSKDGNQDIYTMDLNGGHLNRLTNAWGIDTSPSFSPDGRFMAFCSDSGGSPQIYRMDLSSKSIQRLTFQGRKNSEPVYSSRGDVIAFTHMGADGRFRMAVMQADGSGFKVLHPDATIEEESPSFSPDGRLLVYAGSDGNLYICDLYGSKPVRITSDGGRYSQPCWGPVVR
ncbi:MAG: hypothetical protein ABFD81_17105 [Syntrophaceae bacterium]